MSSNVKSRGYVDVVNNFLDRVMNSQDISKEYYGHVRSFGAFEKNASKTDPYSVGVSLAADVISDLGDEGFGYFSCLSEINGLIKQGASLDDVLVNCHDKLGCGKLTKNASFDFGYKYACKAVLSDGLKTDIKDIAREEFLK